MGKLSQDGFLTELTRMLSKSKSTNVGTFRLTFKRGMASRCFFWSLPKLSPDALAFYFSLAHPCVCISFLTFTSFASMHS